jgi:hypothetical protein
VPSATKRPGGWHTMADMTPDLLYEQVCTALTTAEALVVLYSSQKRMLERLGVGQAADRVGQRLRLTEEDTELIARQLRDVRVSRTSDPG